jgi:hypothetical protein
MDKKKTRLTQVKSLVDLTEAELDEEDFIIRGARIIRSGMSLNGNYYSEAVIEAATPLFEGVNAYANHPHPRDRNLPRDVEKTIGFFDNTRFREGSAYGDFNVLGEARRWLWPLIQASIDKKLDIVALSINAIGEASKGKYEGKPANIVEAITKANSVDAVSAASAGGSFKHLLQSDDGWLRDILANVSMEELTEARPDLVEDFKRQWKTVRDSQAIQEAEDKAAELAAAVARLTEEKQAIQARLDEAQKVKGALQKAALVDSLLEGKTKLPAKWKTVIRTELLEAEPDDWKTIMDREVQKFQAVKPEVAVTGAGRMAPSNPAPVVKPVPVHEALLGVALPDGVDPNAPSEVLIDYYKRKGNK